MRFTAQYPIHPAPARAARGYAEGLLEPDSIRRFAVAAEDVGFDAVAVTEHPAPSQKWIDAGGHDSPDAAVAALRRYAAEVLTPLGVTA